MKTWIRVETRGATFAVVVENSKIVEAAPIARRFVGSDFRNFVRFYKNRWNAKIEKMEH